MDDTHPLRKWRTREKISQTHLAKEVAVTPSHISMIESGQKTPSLPLAVKLSEITKIPVEQFSRAGIGQ